MFRDKAEAILYTFSIFLLGCIFGLIIALPLAGKIQKQQPIDISDLFSVNYYKLYGMHGELVGYQRVDFDGIYYSKDHKNWTATPIPYIKKELVK